jgi:hypothetical protein
MRSPAGLKNGERRISEWRSDCRSRRAPSQQGNSGASAFLEPAMEARRKRFVGGWRNVISQSQICRGRRDSRAEADLTSPAHWAKNDLQNMKQR